MPELRQSDFVQVRQMRYGPDDLRESCLVWCPGCAHVHAFFVSGGGPVWTWDGDLEKPSFEPSMLVKGGSQGITCHSYLRNGVWQFLPDSTHQLAGQNFDMVPLPAWLKKEGEE